MINPIYQFQNLDKVDWLSLSENPNAIHILEKNLDKVHWWNLSSNINAIHLLENNLDNDVSWSLLSRNPNAIHLLEKNLNKFYWCINWFSLSLNPNAIPILEKNLDKIAWYHLGFNPNAHLLLSKLDYQEMKINTQDFSRELVEYVFHPERLIRICERNDLELSDLLEIL